jgi:hypothetical protein
MRHPFSNCTDSCDLPSKVNIDTTLSAFPLSCFIYFEQGNVLFVNISKKVVLQGSLCVQDTKYNDNNILQVSL